MGNDFMYPLRALLCFSVFLGGKKKKKKVPPLISSLFHVTANEHLLNLFSH